MKEERRLTLIEHLEELRYRIIVCFVSIIIFSLISYRYARQILDTLTRPIEKLVFISPLELFLVYLKISLMGGLILSSPIIFYQIWRFIMDGLYPSERKYIKIFFPFSIFLFILGVSFAYFLVIPWGIKFLLSFSTDKIIPMISVSRYLSFILVLIFATGIVFETPLVIILLTKLGIVTPQILRKKWRYAVVLAFVISAIITPTVDIFTQFLLAIPIIFLYAISLLLCKFIYRKK